MAISSPGVGSNLDVNGIVSQLMKIEQQPLSLLTKREVSAQARLSAYGSIKSALSSFQSTMSGLASASRYTTLNATTTDATVATVSTSSLAKTGSHVIEVTALAKAQKLNSGVFSSIDAPIGTGTITILYGKYDGDANSFTTNASRAAETVTIGAGDGTLSGVRDAINRANIGVTAAIINDGSGYRLALSSKETGASNGIRLTVADNDGNNTNTSGLSQLAYDPTAAVGAGKNLTQSAGQAPQDALLTVDGITVTKPSNTITDAIQGLTINLTKTTGGTPLTVTVSRSSSALNTAAQDFVKSYNELHKTIKDLSGYNAQTKEAGLLQGDAAPRTILAQIRNVLTTPIQGLDGSKVSLSQIGITFQKDGTLAVDSTKLNKAVTEKPELVAGFFAATGRASDSGVTFLSAGQNTPVGNYSLKVDTMASRGTLVGSDPITSLTIDDSNKALSVLVDNIAVTVSLTKKVYDNAAELAAELQTQINGSSLLKNAGASVTVSESGGKLTLTSNRYGSTSAVTMTGDGALNLLGATPAPTNGTDVAGSLNGTTATGSGQTLTAENGIKVLVASGSTGDRGNVYYTKGYGSILSDLATSLLDKKGTIQGATSSIESQIKDVGKRRDTLTRQLAMTEKRLRAQFTSLDQMVGSMNQTSTYLQQQLANLNTSTR